MAFFCVLLAFQPATAKKNDNPFPDGFHLGIVGQPEFIVKGKVTPLAGNEPAPKSYWTVGASAGVELSFHFARYFGIAAGINVGTGTSYKESPFIGTIPDADGEMMAINEYDFPLPYRELDYHVPIKFEFHVPIHKNFYFTSELGCSITGFCHRSAYMTGQTIGNEFPFNSIDLNHVRSMYDVIFGGSKSETPMVYENVFTRTNGKIVCELFAGAGIYYKLPYGDLLRLCIGYNAALHTTFEGKYNYFLSNSTGKCEVRHNCIYTQLGYIHTFVYEKNRRCLKRQKA